MSLLFYLTIFLSDTHGQPLKIDHREGIPHLLIPAYTWYLPSDHDDASWRSIQFLVNQSGKVYAAGVASEIYEFDYKTKIIRTIGSIGQGPGQLTPYHVGMNVSEQSLWFMDQKNILEYQDGVFRQSFTNPIPTWRLRLAPPTSSNQLVMFADKLVLPFGRSKEPGEIATAVSTDGRSIESISDPSFDTNYLTLWSPFASNVNLEKHEDLLYASYSMMPKISFFDTKLQFLGHYELSHQDISEHLSEHLYNRKRARHERKVPLISDFQIYKNLGFVISNMNLFAFELHTGRILTVFRFQPMDREGLDPRPQAFQHFTIMPDGMIILGSSAQYSELMIAKLNLEYIAKSEVLSLEYEQ